MQESDHRQLLGVILIDTNKHEGKKYPCREFSSKVDPTQHQLAIHKGMKYPGRECDYQATYKFISLNTSEPYIKERVTHVGNVITRNFKR